MIVKSTVIVKGTSIIMKPGKYTVEYLRYERRTKKPKTAISKKLAKFKTIHNEIVTVNVSSVSA